MPLDELKRTSSSTISFFVKYLQDILLLCFLNFVSQFHRWIFSCELSKDFTILTKKGIPTSGKEEGIKSMQYPLITVSRKPGCESGKKVTDT